MTITREQLALAAKAAGIDVDRIGDRFWSGPIMGREWNPLTDHGQLLDLAMACGMVVDFRKGSVFADYHASPKSFIPGDFHSLAEAVITAAADQQQAKETKE